MRILLNTIMRDNYAFFDKDYPISLSLKSPGANVDKFTPAMLRGIGGGTIIDVDDKSGVEVRKEFITAQNVLLARMGITRGVSAEEKAAQEKAEQEKLEQERIAQEQADAEKLAQEKAEQERLDAEKAEQEKANAIALEQEKIAADEKKKATASKKKEGAE